MVIFARSLKLFLPLFHSTRCFSAHWNANCILLCKYTLNNQIVSAFINQLQFSALGLINRCACSRRGPVGEQLNRTKTDQSYFSTLTLSYNWMSTSYDVVTIIQKACCTRSSNHCLNYAKWDKERGKEGQWKKERETDREEHQIHMYCHHCALNGYGYIKCLFLAAHWLQKKLLLSWYINQKPWNLLIHSKPLPPPFISPHLLFSLFIIFCFIEVIFNDQQVLLFCGLPGMLGCFLTHAARLHVHTHAHTHTHTHSLLPFSSWHSCLD